MTTSDVREITTWVYRVRQCLVHWVVVVALIAGCGRVAFDPTTDADGGTDVAVGCGPWSAPVELTALTTVANDFGPTPVEASRTSTLVTESALPYGLGALFLGLLILLVSTVRSIDRSAERQGRVRRRLSLYTLTGRQPEKEQPKKVDPKKKDPATPATGLKVTILRGSSFPKTFLFDGEAVGVELAAAKDKLRKRFDESTGRLKFVDVVIYRNSTAEIHPVIQEFEAFAHDLGLKTARKKLDQPLPE